MKGNHITSRTQTLVARVPHVIKDTYENHAASTGVPVADLVREALARHIVRLGFKLSKEEREACGL